MPNAARITNTGIAGKWKRSDIANALIAITAKYPAINKRIELQRKIVILLDGEQKSSEKFLTRNLYN